VVRTVQPWRTATCASWRMPPLTQLDSCARWLGGLTQAAALVDLSGLGINATASSKLTLSDELVLGGGLPMHSNPSRCARTVTYRSCSR